jgi:hypothetical protein
MTVKLDHRGWTAAQHLAPCVICHQPAILRSPRGKPCHWTCALAWVNEHQDQGDEHGGSRAA